MNLGRDVALVMVQTQDCIALAGPKQKEYRIGGHRTKSVYPLGHGRLNGGREFLDFLIAVQAVLAAMRV